MRTPTRSARAAAPAAALLAALAAPTAPAAAQTVVVNFDVYPGPDGVLGTPDDVPVIAPTLFSAQTTQLTDQFASVGLLFTPTPPVENKNEILAASTFSPPPTYSAPNLLASSGALTIEGRFTVPVVEVGAILGIGGGADRLDIFDASSNLLGTVTADNVFASLQSATPIDRFVITPSASTTPAIDNLTFTLAPPPPPACYPNCDESTQPPVLNVQDFSCFLTRYAAGESYANCDQSTQPPVLNVQDFSCFLTQYAAGCP